MDTPKRRSKPVSWAALIQRKIETQIGHVVDAIPDDVMTSERWTKETGSSRSNACKVLREMVERGEAERVLFKVRGSTGITRGYKLTNNRTRTTIRGDSL